MIPKTNQGREERFRLFWNLISGLSGALSVVFFSPLIIDVLGKTDYAILSLFFVVTIITNVFDFGNSLTINMIMSSDISLEKKRIYFSYNERQMFTNLLAAIIILLIGECYFFNLPFKLPIKILFLTAAVLFPLYNYYINILLGNGMHFIAAVYIVVYNVMRMLLPYLMVLYYSPEISLFIMGLFAVSLILIIVLRYHSVIVVKKHLFSVNGLDDIGEVLGNKKNSFSYLAFLVLIISTIDRLYVYMFYEATDYSDYSLAFVAASVVNLVIVPFHKSYFPKMASVKGEARLKIFEKSSVVSSELLLLIAIFAIVNSEWLLNFWLGSVLTYEIRVNFLSLLIGMTLSGLTWLSGAFLQLEELGKVHNRFLTAALSLMFVFLVLNEIFQLHFPIGIIWILNGLLMIWELYYVTCKYETFNLFKWITKFGRIPIIGLIWMLCVSYFLGEANVWSVVVQLISLSYLAFISIRKI